MSETEFEVLVKRLEEGDLEPEHFTRLVMAVEPASDIQAIPGIEEESALVREIHQTADLARSI